MKLQLTLSTLLFSGIALAQEGHDKTIYLDSKWKETTEENFTYRRVIKDYDQDKPLYRVEEYYKSGILEMEGTTNDKAYLSHEGEFRYYYESGKLKYSVTYLKGKETGIRTDWYESGRKKSESEFVPPKQEGMGQELKIVQFWAGDGKQTVVNGTGFVSDSTEEYSERGNLVNGQKDGVWEGSDTSPVLTYTETYENGKLISGKSIDAKKVEHIYTEVKVPPRPRKGLQHFYSYIAKKFRINRASEGISGKMVLSFVINKDGEATDFTILKSLSPDLDAEGIRLIKGYPDWSTAEFRGVPVRVLYSIPIVIQAAE